MLPTTLSRIAAATAAVAAAGLTGALVTGTASAAPAVPQHPPVVQQAPTHIFFIMMENHGYSQIINNIKDAPFTNKLAARYDVETNFHGVTHPSLPNYLSMLSGSFQGIFDDCKAGATVKCAPQEFVPGAGDGTARAALTQAQYAKAVATAHLFTGRNLVDQLEAKHLSWKAYMQSMPTPGFEGVSAPIVKGRTVPLYAQKHNPFMYFSDINSSKNPRLKKIVPFETFAADLKKDTVPSFSWITPDTCHDMHGMSAADAAVIKMPSCGYPSSGLDHGAIKLGDAFLKQTITGIMNSKAWKTTNSSIVISWDENDYSGYSGGPQSPIGAKGVVLGGGDAPMLLINSHAGPHETSHQLADHYTVLAFIERLWHLGCLANACYAPASVGLQDMATR